MTNAGVVLFLLKNVEEILTDEERTVATIDMAAVMTRHAIRVVYQRQEREITAKRNIQFEYCKREE